MHDLSHIAYLFSLESVGIKLGLEQIRTLDALLGDPSRATRSIVVAGTNGKGSVTAMLERGLRDAGYRTGRFTSPHLSRLEERFAIDGLDVSTEALEAAAARVHDAAGRMASPPSFFEATTAIAFDLFREAAVDVAVLEVGLGGRLDATNLVDSEAAAITQIDFDHEAWLGHALTQIATEKAGVIKPGALVSLGENACAVREVIGAAATQAGATLIYAPDGVHVSGVSLQNGRVQCSIVTPRASYSTLTLSLRGRHQLANALVAIRMLEELSAHGQFEISAGAIRAAVEGAAWPGRLELIAWQEVEVLIDGAHNPAGARALADYLREVYGRPLPIVVGVMSDKRVDDILMALSPVASHFVCTSIDVGRAVRPDDLAARAAAVAPDVRREAVPDPMRALERAAALGSPVVVAGSLYLAGEIRGRIA
jgi:dihydrofolate synthase/folylpolyglutamate synthase